MPHTDTRVPTHFLLDGGKLSVPDKDASTFLNVYFKFLLKKEKIALVERRTPHFKLFFDLDCVFDCDKSLDDMLETLKSISLMTHHLAMDFFTHEEGSSTVHDCFVCTTTPKNVDGGQKLGAHLVFSSIIVNSTIAMYFRDYILQRVDELWETYNRPSPQNEWNDVFDKAVFNSNGLRIIYATKGKNDDRIYEPCFKIDSNGLGPIVLETPSDKRQIIHACSIRHFNADLTPTAHGVEHEADFEDNHRVAGALVNGKKVMLSIYSEAFETLIKSLPQHYSDASFTGAFEADTVIWLKMNSHYCPNLKREHRTSTIFLEVTRNGMRLRCYCRKEEYGCPKFKSPLIKLPESIIEVFFPAITFIEDEEDIIKRDVVEKLVKRSKTSEKKTCLAGLLAKNPVLKVKPPVKAKRRKQKKSS